MKLKLLLGLVACTFVLTSCQPNEPSSSSSYEHPSSSTPSSSSELAEPPAVEGDYISFHYQKEGCNYKTMALWLWEVGYEGAEFAFNGKDDYGAIAKYALSTWSEKVTSMGLGFIVKSAGSWSTKDPDMDRFVDFSKLIKGEDGGYHVYLATGDEGIYVNPERESVDEITQCEFVTFSSISLSSSNPISKLTIYENNDVLYCHEYLEPEVLSNYIYNFEDDKIANLSNSYKAEMVFAESERTLEKPVSLKNLYSSEEFNSKYTYERELGAIYTNNRTTFKVWSPVSESITLKIYNNGTPTSVDSINGNDATYLSIDMVKDEHGVFSCVVDEDLEGKYYTYVVTNGTFVQKEIVDPYAKSAGVNGLRGMIVDFSKTNPDGWDNISAHPYDRKELTVYETHISDISSSDTWSASNEHLAYAKKFKGAYLSGTTYTEGTTTVSTGFDHIKELGVNAVQFVPIFDQANDEINLKFNWGYNPLNYNVLEGGYSSNPHDGYVRIREFKELVKAYNLSGINIIMDVVYNHVNSANGSNFDVLMPEYYYRYNADGGLSNGSGCGNETASEMPMFRKFMIDSAEFWAKEYKLGGFRYDLMALHDIETMNQVVENLAEINPNICVYGEPWNGGASPLNSSIAASQANANSYVGYGQFNDHMRDALIAGGMKAVSSRAWITNEEIVDKSNANGTPKIRNGIQGFTNTGTMIINDPDKTVNYVTCHDNYTLFDRIQAAGITDNVKTKKMAMLANSVVFTSQGTTFMLAGEEFLRTKGGDHNSYQSSYRVNELDYSLKIKHADMVETYKKLISFKQDVDGMHLDKVGCSSLSITLSKDGNMFSYEIQDSVNDVTYKIFHRNGYKGDDEIKLDLTGYSLYLSTLDMGKTLTSSTNIAPFETIICVA